MLLKSAPYTIENINCRNMCSDIIKQESSPYIILRLTTDIAELENVLNIYTQTNEVDYL